MISLENIIAPIVNDGPTNIYIIGLCLKKGKIKKIKIYNKILDYNIYYEKHLIKFGGNDCLKFYKTTKEWQNLYPGFSGYTIGAEFYYDINKNINVDYGFGFKDSNKKIITFNAYYINNNKQIIHREIYDYISSKKLQSFDNKLQTEFIEIKRSNNKCFCYCPKINNKSIPIIENNIRSALTNDNKIIFDYIKKLNSKYYIVNYGLNKDYEKIYLLPENKCDKNDLLSIIYSLTGFLENLPLDTLYTVG